MSPSDPSTTSFVAHRMSDDPAQHAVNRRCLGALLAEWRRSGGSPELLLTRQGLQADWIAKATSAAHEGFIAWPTFAALLRALGEKLDHQAIRRAGHESAARCGALASGFWMRNFYTIVETYEHVFDSAYAHLSPLHQAFRCLESHCDTRDDGAVRVQLRLKSGHAMSREFFWFMQGLVEGLPRLHGLSHAEALCQWHGRGVDLHLTVPTALPPLAQIRRWLVMSLAPRFLSRELRNAHLALQSKAADLEAQLRLLGELKAKEEAARLRADMASQAKNDFLTAMSHELRTPLNGIVGLAELLAESLPEGETRQDAKTIVTSSHDLRLKIDHLLDYAQLAHENSAPDWAETDIEKLLRELAQHHSPACFAKGLNFNLKTPGSLPLLRTDGRRIFGALSIFLDNACKYSQTGTVTLSASFDAHAVTLEVSDEGPGLNSEKVRHLFSDNEASPPSLRSGLGLVLAARLAESLKAMVGVTSRPGHGAVFSLRLPFTPDTSDVTYPTLPHTDWVAAPPEATGPARTWKPGEGLSILVVEDHALSREVTVRLLRRAGHEVVAASHGLEAAKLCRARAFDLVLLDINLPGMDGIAAGSAILKSSANPPCIMAYTASVSEADKRACQEAGFDGFIAKPASWSDLLAAIETTVQMPRGSAKFAL
jgi:signal transduction histidine kinase/CheY-like chemotaxis protein